MKYIEAILKLFNSGFPQYVSFGESTKPYDTITEKDGAWSR